MVIFLNDLGEAVLSSSPTTVGRNSSDASELVIVAPADSALRNAVVYTAFRLPNGVEVFGGLATDGAGNTVPAPAEELGVETVEEWGSFVAWRQRISSAVTSISGIVAFTIYCSTESMRTSATGTFEVTRAVRSFDPADSAAPDVWEQITVALSSLGADLEEVAGFVASNTMKIAEHDVAIDANTEQIEANTEQIDANTEQIEANTDAIGTLRSNIGTLPNGYAAGDSLWGTLGDRPAQFRRRTVWEATNALSDAAYELADGLTELSDSVDLRVDRLARDIANLEAANKGITYIERSERAFARSFSFPANALPFASLTEIGGVSSNAKILPLIAQNQTDSGLTFDFDEQTEEITINGTALGYVYYFIYQVEDEEKNDEIDFSFEYLGGTASNISFFALVGNVGELTKQISPTSNSSGTLQLPNSYSGWSIALCIGQGTVLNNYRCRIKLSKLGESIRACKVSRIQRKGVNLLPDYSNTTAPLYKNGLAITVLEDGGIHVKGTPTAAVNVKLTVVDGVDRGFSLPAGTYSKSPQYSDAIGNGLVVQYSESGGSSSFWQTGTRTFGADVTAYPYLRFLASTEEIDDVFYPIIAAGTALPNYEKPSQDWAFVIPQAVQNLPGYGLGISPDVCNRIELGTDESGAVTARFVDAVTAISFDGTEAEWNINTTDPNVNKFFFLKQGLTPPSKNNGEILASRFVSSTTGENFTASINSDGFLCFFVPKSVAADRVEWRALLAGWAQSGKPLEVLYQRDTESITDVSAYFADNVIVTKGANPFTVSFVNSEDLPAVFGVDFDETVN